MPGGAHTVLLVEDHQDIREGIADYLRMMGFTVETAPGGAEALACLRDGLMPCVILLDMRMPGMSGWEFREAQLRVPELAAIPVVMFSGDLAQEERAQQLGVREFVAKPFEPDVLAEIVGRHCARTH